MNILHLDIETAPILGYFWGLYGQDIAINQIEETGYTLCWSAKWEGDSEIMFYSLYTHSTEEMLKAIWKLLDKADAVVHYNGKKFDIPVLNWEFVQLGLTPPTSYHQIDLYKTVKANFRLPSYKLDYVARELGLGSKVQHKGMDLWKGCMADREADWKVMTRYNKQDVMLLSKLYKKLLPWIKDHPNHALFVDTTRPICPNCGSPKVHKNGVETTKTQKYQRYRCGKCHTPIRGRTTILKKEEKSNVLTQSKL